MKTKTIDQTYKKSAKLVGLFFLAAMVASLLGGLGFIDPVLSAPNPVSIASEHETQIVIGSLLELVNALSVIGIAAFMFPILKQVNEHYALGYLGLRILEAVWCCMIVISPLALAALSQMPAANTPEFAAAGAALIAIRGVLSDLLIPIFFGLGALLLYSAMYRSRRLPRFISIWGLIAAVLILTLNLVSTFDLEISLALGMVFALPMIANEIFLGIWLLFKGFYIPVE